MSSVNSTSSVAMYETLSKRGRKELVVQSYKFSFHKKNFSLENLGLQLLNFNNCRRIFAKNRTVYFRT